VPVESGLYDLLDVSPDASEGVDPLYHYLEESFIIHYFSANQKGIYEKGARVMSVKIFLETQHFAGKGATPSTHSN
jgi:hypothetical protein